MAADWPQAFNGSRLFQSGADDLSIARYLADEGAVRETQPGFFEIRSDLIRSLLLTRVLTVDRVSYPADQPFPLLSGHVDVKKLIEYSVPHIDKRLLSQLSFTKNSNIKKSAGFPEVGPNEYTYHSQLYRVRF